ncbi:transposase [Micromonospora sp. NBC_01739]|nr:transposase [Micromonospora sp. NBC_01739]
MEDRSLLVGPLLTRRLNTELITGMWEDLLRVAASVKGGHVGAHVIGPGSAHVIDPALGEARAEVSGLVVLPPAGTDGACGAGSGTVSAMAGGVGP